MTDQNSSFDDVGVAAVLARRAREDRDALLDDLVAMLTGVVAGVQVERTLVRRRVRAIRLPFGDAVYLLARAANGSYEASRQQVVRGVAVRTVPLEIEAFLAELGVALDVELKRTERGRAALTRWIDSSNS
ncbi:MAG TPA: hypothetical protein VGI97_10300 [Gemmatimonadaceae bacterium]|jgi:hypothetical protein